MKKLCTLLLITLTGVVFTKAEIYSGTCGENLNWTLNTEDSTLVIKGTGGMSEWEYSSENPWTTYLKNIRNLVIEEGVTSITKYAFAWCQNLKEVSIANSVTAIGRYAFRSCYNLKTISIPDNVTYIGLHAFEECSGLTAITIPESVRTFEPDVFYGCTGLTSIKWEAKYCRESDFSTSFFENICRQITDFTFGENVEYIPSGLCRSMVNLKSITLPSSVIDIGENVFYNCRFLSPIFNTNVFAFLPTAYMGDYEIPQGIKIIAGGACENCTYLTSITIPESVTSIRNYSFYGCNALETIKILCKSNAFLNTRWNISDYGIYGGSTMQNLKFVEAPAVFFDVTESSWTSCPKNLTEVIVNDGELNDNCLHVIGRSYKTLKSLNVSAVTNVEFTDEAFKDYYNLEELLLPSSLRRVCYMMVAGCKNLKSMNIPASVEEIDQSAFEDCRSMVELTFGNQKVKSVRNSMSETESKLRKIGNWAFYNCHELQNITIPEGVTEIGDGAFYGCVYLEELSLPASVESVGDNTFALCAKLKKIVVNAPVPPSIQAKTFYDVKRQIPVYVPDDVVAQYKNDALWGEFDIQGISTMQDAIKEIMADANKTIKLLRNGQVLILRGDKTYTLTGQEVK